MMFLVGQHIRIFPQEDTDRFQPPTSDQVYIIKERKVCDNGIDMYTISHNHRSHDFFLVFDSNVNKWFCKHDFADILVNVSLQ
jgi:hypothetical protein